MCVSVHAVYRKWRSVLDSYPGDQMAVGDVFPIGQMMAASLLTSIPVIIFYGYAQKHLVEGLTVGSVKG